MQKSKAVYAVWVAYQSPHTGAIHTDMWGSAPWVEKELGGGAGAAVLVLLLTVIIEPINEHTK